jgi:bisphosphoglycerate-independent phosphoglycerate mutase (AlkP superfamily)
VIACGQHLTPKRIVFSGDTGIFFTNKQEIELLVKFKQFEGCKLEKAKWERYAMDADLQIDRERSAYDYLNNEYDNLLVVSKDVQKKYNDEYTAHENTKVKLDEAVSVKNKWIKSTFITGGVAVIIIAPLVYLLVH